MADSSWLFEQNVPRGFHYRDDFITGAEELSLLDGMADIAFSDFEMRGVVARRRVAFFGQSYDRKIERPIPESLWPLRAKVAEWAGIASEAFAMVLINEYRPGAGIGWHRDKSHFEDVAGVSLLAPCSFRLRRKGGSGWDRQTIVVEPRSAYLMTGPWRTEWEHSIPPLAEQRYSITLRTLRSKKA